LFSGLLKRTKTIGDSLFENDKRLDLIGRKAFFSLARIRRHRVHRGLGWSSYLSQALILWGMVQLIEHNASATV
jgi:hypothetical protein